MPGGGRKKVEVEAVRSAYAGSHDVVGLIVDRDRHVVDGAVAASYDDLAEHGAKFGAL